jgi:hypothetical protein
MHNLTQTREARQHPTRGRRLVVDEIRVEKKAVTLRGGYAALAYAVAETKPGTLGRVPSFVPKWLAERGSNGGTDISPEHGEIFATSWRMCRNRRKRRC